MKRVKGADFPELRRVFSGYLHEDFLAEYGSPAAALSTFEQDADASERRRFRKEAGRFLEQTEALDLGELRALLAQLGCRWLAPSRKAVVALLSERPNPPANGTLP